MCVTRSECSKQAAGNIQCARGEVVLTCVLCVGNYIPTTTTAETTDLYLHSYLTSWSLAITLHTTRFNIKKFYIVLTLRLYVLYGSHNKQRLLPYTMLEDWFYITEVESSYCVVRAESLYKTDTLSLERANFGKNGGKRSASRAGCYPPGERATRIHWIGDFVSPLASLDSKEKRKTSCWNLESNHGVWVVLPKA